jgi:hypothetical protein
MTWWQCDEDGGVLELDLDWLELEVRCNDGKTVALWVCSQTGIILGRVSVGSA